MKKYYWLLVVVLACGLLFTGCPKHYDWRAENPIIEAPQVEFIPLEYSVTSPAEAPEIPLAPSIIECEPVHSGSILDMWTQKGYVEFGDNKVVYHPADPLCLFLVNDNGEEKSYDIQWLQARKPVVFKDKNGGEGYVDAPLVARDWVWFPSQITVGDGQIAKIPVVVNIPEDADVPDAWAFRIGVVLETTDFVEIKSATYFLMRK